MDAQSMIVDEAQDLEGLKSWFKKTKSKVKNVAKKINVSNIKKVVKKGLHAINRVNPATALLRAGVLASMKLNVMKIASKIRFAYWSDAEAQKNSMDMNKFNQLKRIREKVEKIYFGAGGKTENLKKAILSGKGNRDRRVVLNGLGEIITPVFDEDELRTILGDELFEDEFSEVENGINGLGVVATGTAIASATGVLATIASLIKKLGSLFKQGTPQAQQEVIQDNTDNQEEQTRKFSVQNLISSFSNKQATPTPIVQTRYASTQMPSPLVVESQSQFVDTPNTRVVEDSIEPEPKPEEKGFMAWVKKNPLATGGIAIAVVGGGYLLYKKSQKKKKGLSGIDGTLGAPKKKTKKPTYTKKRRSPTKKRTTKTRRKSPVARASKVKKIELL
jgi:vacuolar-type H+-ATPase subunit E/Vma4